MAFCHGTVFDPPEQLEIDDAKGGGGGTGDTDETPCSFVEKIQIDTTQQNVMNVLDVIEGEHQFDQIFEGHGKEYTPYIP